MRDARKDPLPGLCPRPQDFRRYISGVRLPAMKTAPDNDHRQRPDASSAHRRPSYPLSGCVPAEPDSVSPGNHTLAAGNRDRKYASAPELCLKNPNRFEKASKWVQIPDLLTYPSGKLSAFSQIGDSETPNRRRSLVPGKLVPILFSTSHTEAIARERWGELKGARVTHSSFSFGSIEAEPRRAV